MNKLVLMVDLDDVFWEFNDAYRRWHNKKYGTDFRYEDLYTFDMPELYGVSKAQNSCNVHDFITHSHHTVLPYIAMLDILPILTNYFQLQVATSRHENIHQFTIDAVERYAPDTFAAYHFTDGFGCVGTDAVWTKLEVCQSVDALALIEDAPKHALMVAQGGIPVFLPDKPWNQAVAHPNIQRYYNHSQLVSFCKALIESH